MEEMKIDFEKAALVLIDLQKGIVGLPGGRKVVENAEKLVGLFHKKAGVYCFR